MKHIIKKMLMGITTLAGVSACAQTPQIPTVEPKEFIADLKGDTEGVLLDVRTPDEYAESHIAGAINIDYLDSAKFDKEASKLDKGHTYYVYCRSGHRSLEAARKMSDLGFKTVDLKGGILNWESQGLPVEK